MGAEHKRQGSQAGCPGAGQGECRAERPPGGAVITGASADSAQGRGKSNDTEFDFTKLCSQPGLMVLVGDCCCCCC